MSNRPNNTTVNLLREGVEFYELTHEYAEELTPKHWIDWYEQAKAEIERLDAKHDGPTHPEELGARIYVSVHDRHCCSKHGCKYADLNCPVMHGTEQGVECEMCSDEQMVRDQKILAAAHRRVYVGDKADI